MPTRNVNTSSIFQKLKVWRFPFDIEWYFCFVLYHRIQSQSCLIHLPLKSFAACITFKPLTNHFEVIITLHNYAVNMHSNEFIHVLNFTTFCSRFSTLGLAFMSFLFFRYPKIKLKTKLKKINSTPPQTDKKRSKNDCILRYNRKLHEHAVMPLSFMIWTTQHQHRKHIFCVFLCNNEK